MAGEARGTGGLKLLSLGGVVAQPARDQLVKLYQLKNGSTDGLDQLINSKKPQ